MWSDAVVASSVSLRVALIDEARIDKARVDKARIDKARLVNEDRPVDETRLVDEARLGVGDDGEEQREAIVEGGVSSRRGR